MRENCEMENLKYVKKSEKHQETKGFLRLAVNQNNEFSRPPRYDRFDTPPRLRRIRATIVLYTFLLEKSTVWHIFFLFCFKIIV